MPTKTTTRKTQAIKFFPKAIIWVSRLQDYKTPVTLITTKQADIAIKLWLGPV